MKKQDTVLLKSLSEQNDLECIGIGSKNYDPNNPEPYLLPSDKSDNGWLEFLKESSPLEILHAMNYLLLTDSWTDRMFETISTNFLEHINEIKEVLANWFHEGTELFKYIDLTIEDENNYEIINENDVDLNQKFIPASMWGKLESDLKFLQGLVK